jgi:hypothetical protein
MTEFVEALNQLTYPGAIAVLGVCGLLAAVFTK